MHFHDSFRIAGQISGTSAATKETSTSGASYLESLTQEELDTTEALAQHYFTEEVTSFEGVDQIYRQTLLTLNTTTVALKRITVLEISSSTAF